MNENKNKEFEKLINKVNKIIEEKGHWDEDIFNEILKRSFKKEIEYTLKIKTDINNILFDFLLSVYVSYDCFDYKFLGSLISKYLHQTPKIFYVCKKFFAISDKLSSKQINDIRLCHYVNKVLDLHYYNKLKECSNKEKFVTPYPVHFIMVVILLLGEINCNEAINKFKLIVETQERNEPTLAHEAEEALKKL